MSRYNHFEVDEMLDNMVVLYDTREQLTKALQKRLTSMPCRTERRKLNYGDYSAEATLPDGGAFCLADKVVIERKMSLDEISMNFTKERARFVRELERAKADNVRVHFLIENGNWQKVLLHKYRSRFSPDAFSASLLAWCARYDIHIHFCPPEHTGKLIYLILRYELREILNGMEDDTECEKQADLSNSKEK